MRITRRGVTLYQLLVLLAILAILAGFLIPAIARVRLAAARSQSANNLKQIGLACHNYHDVNGNMPPGVDDKNFSAAAYLLPYIEQDNLFKMLDFQKPCDDKANENVRNVYVKTFLSPNDTMGLAGTPGPTNYLYNAGSKYDLKDNDGIFYRGSKVKLGDVTDGTSNTLLAGETLRGDGDAKPVDVRRKHVALKAAALKNADNDSGTLDFKDGKNLAGNRCASWIDGRFLQGTFTGTRAVNDDKPDVDFGGAGGLSGLRTLSNTTNTAFCDGSVRTISVKTSAETIKLLSGRDDGQVIPADF